MHGDIVVIRKVIIQHENNYQNYRTSLKEDFKDICGYCGKTEMVSRRGFEIDHFVPIDTDETRKTDYGNLVYSCFTCNRKKSKKWPTNNPICPHDGREGFVDPTNVDFDNHLGRETNGRIEFYTQVGSYMIEAFKFNTRPTATVWKTMELMKRKCQLRELKQSGAITETDKDEYIDIDTAVDDFLRYLGQNGE